MADLNSIDKKIDALTQGLENLSKKVGEIAVSTEKQIDTLAIATAKGFEEVSERFDKVEERLGEVDKTLDIVDQKLERIERRLDDQGEMFYSLDTRLTKLEPPVATQ